MSEEEIEVAVRVIWSDTLTNFDLLPGDNFFELGGDSLQMMDMLFAVSKAVKVDIEPQLLFEDASLEGFTSLVKERAASSL